MKDKEWLKKEVRNAFSWGVNLEEGGMIRAVDMDYVIKLIDQLDEPEIETATNKDMVNRPTHYQGIDGLEVEDVLRNFIPRYTDPYVGHRIASAIEYLLRSPLKNGQQDIEKARKNLDQALGYMEEKEE